MTEPKKNDGKLAGRSKSTDSMPHDVVIAAVQGVAGGIATGAVAAVASKLTSKPSPKKPQRKK